MDNKLHYNGQGHALSYIHLHIKFLGSVKPSILHFVRWLILRITIARMIYCYRRVHSRSRDIFKFWEMSGNISETVQDRDMVSAEDK